MPEAARLFEDQLDDPILRDVQASFLGGQVSNLRANQLDPTQWAYLENIDVSRNGLGKTRRGTSKLSSGVAGTGTFAQGLFYYDTPSLTYLIAANNAKLYSWQSPNWVQIAAAWTGTDTSVPYQFAQLVNSLYFVDGIGTLQGWDGTTLTDLGGAGNTDPPAAIGSLVAFTNRLVAAKVASDPDGVYFSNFLPTIAAAMWNRTTQQLRVGGGEGDPITGLCPWLDFNLIVFKKRSIWVVNCDPTASVSAFTIKPVHRLLGCLAPRTAAQVGSDVFFLANDGVRSVQRTIAAETQSELSPNLSEPIQDIIDRINWAAIDKACACFRDNKYILALPLDGSTTTNYCAVYSALNKTWSGVWTGWSPTAFALFVDSGVTKLAIGDSSGNVSQWLDYVQPANEVDATFQDNGTNIAVMAKSRALDFGAVRNPKSGLDVEFEFYNSSADVVVQTVVDDETTPSAFVSFPSYGSSVTIPVVLPFVLLRSGIIRKPYDLASVGQFRELQFRITTASKKLSMRSLVASAFVDAYNFQEA